MNLTGTVQGIYNIIDRAHIEAIDKKIFITTTELDKVRRWWAGRQGCAIFNGRVVIHIRGRSDWSHLIDRPASFRVESQPSFGGRQRIVLVSANVI